MARRLDTTAKPLKRPKRLNRDEGKKKLRKNRWTTNLYTYGRRTSHAGRRRVWKLSVVVSRNAQTNKSELLKTVLRKIKQRYCDGRDGERRNSDDERKVSTKILRPVKTERPNGTEMVDGQRRPSGHVILSGGCVGGVALGRSRLWEIPKIQRNLYGLSYRHRARMSRATPIAIPGSP